MWLAPTLPGSLTAREPKDSYSPRKLSAGPRAGQVLCFEGAGGT
jgi:hypothetical protein